MPTKERFDIPAGDVARARIIDTTTSIRTLETHHVLGPAMPGMYLMPEIPAWSFLVESPNGGKALFDLGVPPNWQSFSPWVIEHVHLDGWGWQISSERHVADILKDEGVSPASITDLVWSHWHWDHIGDPSTFPSSTVLNVGPGFKEAFLPAYPSNPNSPVRDSDFAGREVREISFEDSPNVVRLGHLRAFDLWGDGSFYLLDTPGHAIGHLAGLARTTPCTFILMAGDLCHHGGALRPSDYSPLPKEIQLDGFDLWQGGVCPGAKFEALQTRRGRKPTQPFFEPAFGHDIPLAMDTISKVQVPDAEDNVLVIFAHDRSIRGIVDMFPLDVNDWKAREWRGRMFWRFLEDFKDAIENHIV